VSDAEPLMIPMTRREALKAATALMGGALAGPIVLGGCARESGDAATEAPDRDDQALLGHIADTLLPPTAASPGASAAGVGATLALLLADCKGPDVQQRVTKGLHAFRATCRDRGGGAFASLPQPERERLLREVDAEAQAAGDKHWFAAVRELALIAYFTSEVGLTQAMRYVPIPGRWQGCVPLESGQPAWG
jgi:hypothetical protein